MTLVKAANALRDMNATPRFIYCNQAFHDELLTELNSCLRSTAYQSESDHVDTLNALELIVTPGDGEASFVMTCDKLP